MIQLCVVGKMECNIKLLTVSLEERLVYASNI